MRMRNIFSRVISLTLVAAGLALAGFFALNFFGPELGATATNEGDPASFSVPNLETPQGEQQGVASGPQDKTLTITIPEMSRIEDDSVPTTVGDDEQALKQNAAIHLKGTGFPWQEESNTYLAGHRLGYPGTDSWLTFWDLDVLEKGDKVFVTDAEGTEYTYRVYRQMVVEPSELRVTGPVSGKNILTLQTCTLPDYSDRLLVRAELVDKKA